MMVPSCSSSDNQRMISGGYLLFGLPHPPSSSSLAFAGWLVSWLVDDDGGWGSCYIKGERELVAIERSKLRKKVMGQSWRQDKSSSSDADPTV
jgi:hypothetical protein